MPKKLCRHKTVVPLVDEWSPRSTGGEEKESTSGKNEERLAVGK